MAGKTALIDADGLIYIICYNKTVRDELGIDISKPAKTLDECKASMDIMIRNILLATGADQYLLFLTVGKNFRYTVYPEYKANRKYGEKPEHFDRIKEYLITEHKAVFFHELEADDLCLIYSKKISNSFICSPDKDMLGLEGSHYNYSKTEWKITSNNEAYCNFWASMITGDASDNIKGIPGMGPAAVKKMQFEEHSDDLSLLVLSAYISKFGEEVGIEEFYKNYKVLKIRDNYEGLSIADPIKFGSVSKEDNELQKGDTW